MGGESLGLLPGQAVVEAARAGSPQAGRYRQFHQYGVEALGSASPVLDAEVIQTLLALFDADVQLHDGASRSTRKSPVLIRCSAGQAVPVAWESLMTLRAPRAGDPAPAGPDSLPRRSGTTPSRQPAPSCATRPTA